LASSDNHHHVAIRPNYRLCSWFGSGSLHLYFILKMYKKLTLAISGLILLYGIFANNPFLLDNKEKAILAILLYSIPLLCQFLKGGAGIKIYAIWWGIFLILSSVLLARPIEKDYVTLRPDAIRKTYIKPGVLIGLSGEQLLTTDEQGYRVTKKIDYKNKAPDKYRIFAIGGSTTEQIYIDQSHTWTHLLQEKLDHKFKRDFEVIGTGVSGTRLVNHLATLKKIISYHPDMVVFLFGINDWNHQISSNYQIDHNVENHDFAILVDRLSYKKTLGIFVDNIIAIIKLKLFNLADKKDRQLNENPYENLNSLAKADKREFKPSGVPESYQEQLAAINQLCDQQKIKCVFLTQPNGYKKWADKHYTELFWMTPPGKAPYTLTLDSMEYIAKLYNDYTINFVRQNDKILCDIDAKIPPSSSYMYDECHFNLGGAIKASELLFKCIENKL
jgi:lysophospholipase L1-like esterase